MLLRVYRQLPDPGPEHRLVQLQVSRGLRHRDPTLLDQPHRLKLELSAELPSCRHKPPPVSYRTLTRCLLNRQQAIRYVLYWQVMSLADAAENLGRSAGTSMRPQQLPLGQCQRFGQA